MDSFDSKSGSSNAPRLQDIRLLTAAADIAGDALFVKDLAGRYLFCNAAAERFVGRARGELLGCNDLELFGEEVAAAMQAHDDRVLASGMSEVEERVVGSPGNERICEVTKTPYRDLDGTIIGVVGTAREVTETRHTRQKLLYRQAVLEGIAQGAPLGDILNDLVRLIEDAIPGALGSCLLLDDEGSRLYVAAGRSLPDAYNAAIQGIAVGPRGGSCGTAVFRAETIVVENIAADPLWTDFRQAALEHGLQACVSVPIFSRKTPAEVLGTFAVYFRRPGPPPPRLLASISDVEYLACIAVENSRTMRKLQAEEARFRTFAENTSDAFMLHGRDGTVIDANPQACAQLGFTREELYGMLPTDFDPAVTSEGLNQILAKLEKGERLTFDSIHRRKDGTTFPVEVRLTPFHQGEEVRTVAVVQDITERKLAEAALQASERRYRELADAIPQIVWTADAAGSITHINAKVTEYTGQSASELTGWSWERVIHPDDIAHTVRDWTMTVQSGIPRDIEFRIRRTDGAYRWHITRQVPARDASGKITTWYGTCTDVEDLKQAEAAVRESEERFRNVLDFSPALIYLKDLSHRYLFVNRKCAASLGVPQAEWVGKTAHDFFPAEAADQFMRHDRRVLETQCPHQVEESVVQRDGRRIDLLSIQFPLFHTDGRPYAICGISTDITDRKQAEAELHKTAELLRAVADGTSDALFVKDRNGKYLFFNEAASRFVGKPVNQVLGVDDTALFDAQSAQYIMARDRHVMETGNVETEEETVSAAGITRTFLATKGPYRDERGNIVGTIGIATDITERKRAEQVIRANEERYRTLFESCGDAIYVLSFTGRICSANPAAARMTGYSAAELVTMSIGDLDGDSDAERVPERLDRLRTGETLNFEVIQRRKDGTTYPVEVVATPMRIGDEEFILAFDRDISVRKEAERSLRLKQFSIERAVDSIFWISPEGEILYANEAACRTLGYTRRELIGKSVPDIDPNFPEAKWPAHWEEIKRRGSFTFESERITRDGRMLKSEITVNYLRYENREYNCAVLRDITQRKQAEQERDRLWNHSPDLLCIAGFDGKLKQINPAWTEILGWSPEELLGQAWIELVHPDDREAALAAEHTLLRGEALTGLENRYRCKNGQYRWFSWNAIPLPEQQTICAFARDITRERTLAEQFRQAQKMEAIGRLAGGIAHDFNNLLTVINGYSSLLLGAIHDDARRKPLEVMHKAGQRAATLTSQLLAFSRKAIVDLQVLDLNHVVESITGMLGRMIGEDIQLKLDLAPSLSHVAFDPGQLEQVLMNLAVNARDAMPDGGILTISTREAESPSNDREKPSNLPPGRYVQLIVADDGLGMNDEVKAQIFEPFFTTKGVGIGTGLGLATVYGAVQQAGGVIAVESQPGRGTTFRIWLPAKGRRVTEIEEKPVGATPSGQETVLVVEDEHDVRGLVRFVLDMQGYRVLEADSGSSAIQAAAEFQGPIHLLLTDLVMNDLGGRELAEHIRSSRPDINVLYMSGYTEDEIVRRGVRDSRSEFLQKPFSPDALAEKVRQVLDAGPSNDR